MEANKKRSGYDYEGGGKGDDAGEGKGGGKGSKKGEKGVRGGAETLQCGMKFLTPEVLASAIIGKGGAVIAAMRSSCQAKLALTEQGEFYPSTDCRVLTVQANEQGSLAEVSNQIVGKVAELANGQSGGNAEGIVGNEGELKLKTIVPKAAVGGIIGKQGAAIKALRETSGAKISISDPCGSGPGAEQTVSITGTAQALEAALKEVNNQIQLLNGESWFQTWLTGPNGGYAPSYGGYAPSQVPYRGGGNMNSAGVNTMMSVAANLPSYVMEDSRGFALCCVVPNRLVGGLIGRGGAGTKEVQMQTGTKIGIREIPGDEENRSMNIAGPLANTCAAYMLMMKRYLDAEAAAAASGPAPGP